MYYKNNVVNDWLVWHLHLSVVIFLKVFKFYLLQKICKGDLTLDPLPQSPLYLPPAILNCEGSCKPFNGLEIWNPRCSLSFPYSAASMDHTDSKWSAQSVWGGVVDGVWCEVNHTQCFVPTQTSCACCFIVAKTLCCVSFIMVTLFNFVQLF